MPPTIPALNNVIDLAVGSEGAVWAVTAGNKVHELVIGPPETTWVDVPGAAAKISMGRAPLAWGLDPKGALNQYQWFANSWNPVAAGPFVAVSSAFENEAWAIDRNGEVFAYGTDGTGERVPGTLVGIDAGGDGNAVWGVNSAGNIYRLNAERTAWTQIPGKLAQISVGADGTVMGVSSAGILYLRQGDGWVAVSRGVRKVSCGNSSNIWVIDARGNVVCLVSELIAPDDVDGEEQWLAGKAKRWDSKDKFDQTKSTHLWLVCRAAEVARVVPGLGERIYKLVAPGAKQGDSQFHDALCRGLWDADEADPYRNSTFEGDAWYGTLSATYKSHFYDPSTQKNWLGEKSPTALTEGKKFFAESVAQYKLGNLSAAGYALGLALHYLTDMTQPMHSTNYTFLSSVPVGFHSAFETLALEVMRGVQISAPYASPPSEDPGQILIATAKKSASRAPRITSLEMVEAWYNYVAYGRDDWTDTARREIRGALADGVGFTAQFLVAWMNAAKQSVPDTDPRIFSEIHETSKRKWWALHTDGHLMFRDGYGASWMLMDNPDPDRPVGHLSIDSSDNVYAATGQTAWMAVPGKAWQQVYPPVFVDPSNPMAGVSQLVVATPAELWAVDSTGRVFRGTGLLPNVDWQPTDSPEVSVIAASPDSCWAANSASGQVWEYSASGWVDRGTGVAVNVSLDSRSKPWGISPAGTIVTYDGAKWYTPAEFSSDFPSDMSTPDWGALRWISVQRSTLLIDADGVPWGPAVLATNENPWMPLA